MSDAEQRSPISPTAHYTAAVWARHGLSHPALATPTGRLMFHGMRAPMAVSKLLGGPTLEDFLLARHQLIDALLERAIEAGEVTQVIEIAAGLSARGWRFAGRYGDRITYLETDLPAMVSRKREALEEAGTLGPLHRVVPLDALSEDGPQSLAAVVAELDSAGGLAIVTEGLLSYLDRAGVDGLWRRIARTLSGFEHGLYLSDLHLASENTGIGADAFVWMLGAFVRGKVELHFEDEPEALAALERAGFAEAHLPRGDHSGGARGARSVRVIEARI